MVQDKKPQKSSAAEESMESTADDSDYSDSDMDSMLADEPHQTYFFGAELTADEKEFTWEVSSKPHDDSQEGDESQMVDDDDDAVKHVLKLRQVALGRGAKAGERNILELEVISLEGEPVTKVIASLSVGVQEMGVLQLDFDGSLPITLRLVEGSGPLHITGSHEMFLQYHLDDNGELDETADNIEELSEEEEVMSPRPAKRKKENGVKPKKSKVETKDEEEEEEDEEGEQEEEDQEEEMEEEEEEEPKPKQKTKNIQKMGKVKSPKDLMKQKIKAKKIMKKKLHT